MKRGFRYSVDEKPTKAAYMARDDVLPDEKSLFGSVIDQDWTELMNGFGRSLSRIFVDTATRPNPNDSAFADSVDRAEIMELVKQIYRRI
jgi:hypothetical protein